MVECLGYVSEIHSSVLYKDTRSISQVTCLCNKKKLTDITKSSRKDNLGLQSYKLGHNWDKTLKMKMMDLKQQKVNYVKQYVEETGLTRFLQ